MYSDATGKWYTSQVQLPVVGDDPLVKAVLSIGRTILPASAGIGEKKLVKAVAIFSAFAYTAKLETACPKSWQTGKPFLFTTVLRTHFTPITCGAPERWRRLELLYTAFCLMASTVCPSLQGWLWQEVWPKLKASYSLCLAEQSALRDYGDLERIDMLIGDGGGEFGR